MSSTTTGVAVIKGLEFAQGGDRFVPKAIFANTEEDGFREDLFKILSNVYCYPLAP